MSILDKAIVFATQAHCGAFRKGTKTPYIVHTLEAAAIAASITVDEEVIAAAVLHDIIEDTPVTEEQLIKEFGNRVVGLVCADSEDKRSDKPAAETWGIRKRETLDYIPAASRDEQIIILSDKLSNMRSIYRDNVDIGDALWDKFNMKDKSKQGWYYCGIAERLDKVKDTHAYLEYLWLTNKVFKGINTPDKAKCERWYDEETEQFKRQLERDFDEKKSDSEDDFMDALFKDKPKKDEIKLDHYSWSENSVYRFYEKEFVNKEIEDTICMLVKNELFRSDMDFCKRSLRLLIKNLHYEDKLPSCSEWEDKNELERKALEILVKLLKNSKDANILQVLDFVRNKLREAKLFENKKDAQLYERIKYELTECTLKEFESLKKAVADKNG